MTNFLQHRTRAALAALIALAFSGCAGGIGDGGGAAPSGGAGAAALDERTSSGISPPGPAKHVLYVANTANGSVDIYPAGLHQQRIGEITTGVFKPNDVFVDPAGTLYVANGNDTITEYAAGSSSPAVTLPTPNTPFNVTVGADGTVSECGATSVNGPYAVVEFDPGAKQPSREIKYANGDPDPLSCGGLAADAAGNLYVNVGSGGSSGGYAAYVYAPKKTKPYRTLYTSNGYAYGGIEIEHGHMLVGDPYDDAVVIESLPKGTVTRTLATERSGEYLSLDTSSGYLYTVSRVNSQLQIYDYASGRILELRNNYQGGVAVFPPAY